MLQEIDYWNLAKLVGISFLKVSACLPTSFSLKSSMPLTSVLRSPLPYITVKSGTTSPSGTSQLGPILQCYFSASAKDLVRGLLSYLAEHYTLPNFRIDFNHTSFPYPLSLHHSAYFHNNPIINNYAISLVLCWLALNSNGASFADYAAASNFNRCKC